MCVIQIPARDFQCAVQLLNPLQQVLYSRGLWMGVPNRQSLMRDNIVHAEVTGLCFEPDSHQLLLHPLTSEEVAQKVREYFQRPVGKGTGPLVNTMVESTAACEVIIDGSEVAVPHQAARGNGGARAQERGPIALQPLQGMAEIHAIDFRRAAVEISLGGRARTVRFDQVVGEQLQLPSLEVTAEPKYVGNGPGDLVLSEQSSNEIVRAVCGLLQME